MLRNRNNNTKPKVRSKKKQTQTYSYPKTRIEFYISEETATYGKRNVL
jgi:hypothetical protein